MKQILKLKQLFFVVLYCLCFVDTGYGQWYFEIPEMSMDVEPVVITAHVDSK